MEADLILVILKEKMNRGGVPLNFHEGGEGLKFFNLRMGV